MDYDIIGFWLRFCRKQRVIELYLFRHFSSSESEESYYAEYVVIMDILYKSCGVFPRCNILAKYRFKLYSWENPYNIKRLDPEENTATFLFNQIFKTGWDVCSIFVKTNAARIKFFITLPRKGISGYVSDKLKYDKHRIN